MILSRENVSKCVLFIRQPLSEDKFKFGTGTFISNGGKLAIITASHIAEYTNDNAEFIISDEYNKPIILNASQFNINGIQEEWIHHREADISICEIKPQREIIEKFMTERFLPLQLLSSERKPPSRDTTLTTLGFPLTLGSKGYFSPLTFESKASSGLLTMPRFDNHQLSTFFVLQDPAIGGYSGGPVFDLSIYKMGCVTTTGEGTKCYGIIHGTLSDNTGGKLAAVTPSYNLFDLI